MAPQTSISRLANVLGTIGTVCWCIQLCPQIWRNWRTRSTEGLPAMSMYLWLVSAVPFGVYAIVQNFNIPLQVQPQCFCLLCGISWLQCLIFGRYGVLHYWDSSTLKLDANLQPRQWRTRIAILLFLALIPLYITLQIGLVLAIRPAYARGVEWPVYLTGISAFVLMICGYLLILFEPIKRRGRVVGIDFIFLGVDWAGAFFSLLSLVAQGRFDIMFGIL